MLTIGIMANGPASHIPNLARFKNKIDIWIGADFGALTLIEQHISVDYAVGDFDSIDEKEMELLASKVTTMQTYPAEKDETDLEIAIQQAFELKPDKIYLFGVTGGRMDHTLINMQLLHTIVDKNIRGIIVDTWNELELTKPGTYVVSKNECYPYISFVPFTEHVRHLSLFGFYYPLEKYNISWGSSRCISNELVSEKGTFTYDEGMLMLIQSRDAT